MTSGSGSSVQDALVDEGHEQSVDAEATQDDENHQEDDERRVRKHGFLTPAMRGAGLT